VIRARSVAGSWARNSRVHLALILRPPMRAMSVVVARIFRWFSATCFCTVVPMILRRIRTGAGSEGPTLRACHWSRSAPGVADPLMRATPAGTSCRAARAATMSAPSLCPTATTRSASTSGWARRAARAAEASSMLSPSPAASQLPGLSPTPRLS